MNPIKAKNATRNLIGTQVDLFLDVTPSLSMVSIFVSSLSIALLTIGVNFQGALYTGFFVNPLDIASNYAGKFLSLEIEFINNDLKNGFLVIAPPSPIRK